MIYWYYTRLKLFSVLFYDKDCLFEMFKSIFLYGVYIVSCVGPLGDLYTVWRLECTWIVKRIGIQSTMFTKFLGYLLSHNEYSFVHECVAFHIYE